MRLLVKIIFILFFQNINAIDFNCKKNTEFNKPYVFVSLGCNCWQAQALRKKAHSLRDAAFPFDWLLTPDTEKLIRCLDENFKHFYQQDLFFREGTDVTNTYYNFKFTHD